MVTADGVPETSAALPLIILGNESVVLVQAEVVPQSRTVGEPKGKSVLASERKVQMAEPEVFNLNVVIIAPKNAGLDCGMVQVILCVPDSPVDAFNSAVNWSTFPVLVSINVEYVAGILT